MKRDSVALIGCGRWGQNYIPSLGKYWNNVNIFDPNRDKIREIKARYSDYSYPESITDLSADGPMDIILCVPPSDAPKSLKHWVNNCDRILVEKPCFPKFSGVPDSFSRGGSGYIGHIRLQTHLISFLEEHCGSENDVESVHFSRIYPDRRFAQIGLIPDLFIHDVAVIYRLLGGKITPLKLQNYEETMHRLQISLKDERNNRDYHFLYATDSDRRDDYVEISALQTRFKLDDRSNILYKDDEVIATYTDEISPLEKQIKSFCRPSKDEIDLFTFGEMVSLEEYLDDTFGHPAVSGL
ncbi:MAG: hypothetical protein K8F25_07705 [Fimbriimonadaceae bacterium]|nr:hypothetical protein [Alphaproteobacteria bacterium]